MKFKNIMIYHSLIANKVNNVATGLDTLEYSTKNIFYKKKSFKNQESNIFH